MIVYPLILHELFYSMNGLLVLGAVLLIVPGTPLAAWGVRVSRRSGGKSLAIQTGTVIGILIVAAAIVRNGDLTIVLVALIAGLTASAAVVHRLAPRIVETPTPLTRAQPFDPPRRGVLGTALIGGATFAIATVIVYATVFSVAAARH
jgi:hypothetical protein